MKTITKSPDIKTQDLIYNPIVKYKTAKKIQVMRVELNEKFTRIDFAYNTDSKYINGGWVQMHDSCFIRPVKSEVKFPMIKAVNIPIAPRKHYFKTVKDCLFYTLFFPALPINTKAIDIIELETNDPNFFNFYGVTTERIEKEVINVFN